MTCYTTSMPVRANVQNAALSPDEIAFKGAKVMKSTLASVLTVLVLVAASSAKELPTAPSSVIRDNDSAMVTSSFSSSRTAEIKTVETKIIDKRFISLAMISAGSTFADSYTTLFARQNWLAGKQGVCNVEVQSAYLYGTHPTVGRAYAVASVKTVGSIVASYYLRKHHSKLWSLPLVANSIMSLQGTTQNMIACN
jgi:hypothetical protein